MKMVLALKHGSRIVRLYLDEEDPCSEILDTAKILGFQQCKLREQLSFEIARTPEESYSAGVISSQIWYYGKLLGTIT